MQMTESTISKIELYRYNKINRYKGLHCPSWKNHRQKIFMKYTNYTFLSDCKGDENSESERHTGYCFVLLAVVAPRLKTG